MHLLDLISLKFGISRQSQLYATGSLDVKKN